MGWSAFRGTGRTIFVAATTTGSTAVQAIQGPGEPEMTNYILSNSTAVPIFVAVSATNDVVAVVPTGSTVALSQRGYYLGPSASHSISESPSAWFSVVATATTSGLFITVGDGL